MDFSSLVVVVVEGVVEVEALLVKRRLLRRVARSLVWLAVSLVSVPSGG